MPHVRTAGGHRRFDPEALRQWLARQPARTPRPTRQGPVQIPVAPMLADALRGCADRVSDAVEALVEGPAEAAYRRLPPPERRGVVRAWVDALADAFQTGSLADALERAETYGRGHGLAGSSAEVTLGRQPRPREGHRPRPRRSAAPPRRAAAPRGRRRHEPAHREGRHGLGRRGRRPRPPSRGRIAHRGGGGSEVRRGPDARRHRSGLRFIERRPRIGRGGAGSARVRDRRPVSIGACFWSVRRQGSPIAQPSVVQSGGRRFVQLNLGRPAPDRSGEASECSEGKLRLTAGARPNERRDAGSVGGESPRATHPGHRPDGTAEGLST